LVTVFAGGALRVREWGGHGRTFNAPTDVRLTSGNIYVADSATTASQITSAGVVSTFAGSGSAAFADGTGTAASFSAAGRVDRRSGNI
jgi:hypothetical protein